MLSFVCLSMAITMMQFYRFPQSGQEWYSPLSIGEEGLGVDGGVRLKRSCEEVIFVS